MLTITNEANRTFNVTLQPAEDGEMLVKFYDASFVGAHDGWELGQPASSYYAKTLTGHPDFFGSWDDAAPRGLALDGGVPVWDLSADNMVEVVAFIRNEGIA